ncbi:MAG: flagellar hook-associated protein FlgK [Oscillospiraceae bacterium]
MSSTFLGIEIGKSGLAAAQIAINITGQNISNADTAGYTMQKVRTSAVEAAGGGYVISQITSASNVGQGVTVLSIDQVRSAYLDEQYRDQYSDFCSSEFMTQGLSYLENLFNETDDDTSITTSIKSFFDALSEFSDDTTSEAARTTVQQTALSLTSNFNMIYTEMVDLYNDQNTSVQTVATQINVVASQIAELNKQISEYERSGESANDLRDERNLALDKLSGYAAISYNEDEKGMVNVYLGGETLVDGKTVSEIQITTATDEINTICQQLASLNTEISGTAGGITVEQAAQRDSLTEALEAISGKITCDVDGSDGTVSVSINYVDQDTATQKTDSLVSGGSYTETTSGAVTEYDGADDEFVLKLGSTYLGAENVGSGELYSHLALRDNETADNSGIPYYISMLDGLAQTMSETVNACMNKGYTYPDEENGDTSVSEIDMFEDFGNDYSLITAGNFSLSEAVQESVWNIAGSSEQINLDSESGTTNAANNEIALELSELMNTNSYSDSLNSLISQLGLEVQSSQSALDLRQSLTESIENQRQSISGVSIDEEAVNLIKYEQVYSACSRVITTIDDMLDRLINSTGRVGL